MQKAGGAADHLDAVVSPATDRASGNNVVLKADVVVQLRQLGAAEATVAEKASQIGLGNEAHAKDISQSLLCVALSSCIYRAAIHRINGCGNLSQGNAQSAAGGAGLIQRDAAGGECSCPEQSTDGSNVTASACVAPIPTTVSNIDTDKCGETRGMMNNHCIKVA